MSLGNILSGLMGGTPCTGVLVRTAVNCTAGATDKMSQFINAVVVFLIVYLFMPGFVYMPLPVIAPILVTSACRLVPIKVIKELWVLDKTEVAILFVTALVCIFVDSALGLMVGGVISILRTAIKSQDAELD